MACAASANGDLIGKIHLPETAANLTFGGPKKNRLFICASTSVYRCISTTLARSGPEAERHRERYGS